jgi:hypothetical protein
MNEYALLPPRFEPDLHENRSDGITFRPTSSIEFSRSVSGWRIHRLLTCDTHQVPLAAVTLAKALSSRTEEQQQPILWELAEALAGPHASTYGAENGIAALEVLVGFGFPTADLIYAALCRPVQETHLFLVVLSAELRSKHHQCLYEATDRTAKIAERVVQIYDEIASRNEFGDFWNDFSVETFRALASICPLAALGPITRHLRKIADISLTDVLSSIVAAARALSAFPIDSCDLLEATNFLFGSYTQDGKQKEAVNVPGVISRILEIRGRCLGTLKPEFVLLRDHVLRSEILYLFIDNNPFYLDETERSNWYMLAFESFARDHENQSLKELLSIIARDVDVSRGLIHGLLRPSLGTTL